MIGERRPLDELHDEGRDDLAFLQTVDDRDVGMVQRGEHFGFTLEARKPIAIGREPFGQHLERDLTLQINIRGSIHLAHATRADLSGNFVWAESSTGREHHVCAILQGLRA
jgi:hypothetical protein